MEWEQRKVPEVVALVAMGNSRMNYVSQVMKTGCPKGVADETWVINKLGSIYKHDILFRMDDLRKPRKINQRVICDKDKVTVHDRQDEWMRNHDRPIITSTAYPEYPTSVTYPLEAVINTIGYSYFLTTPAYAAAFAIHIGVKHLKLYGCDFVYTDNKYVSEMGKGNMEFILAIGMMKGVKIEVAKSSTLLGMNLEFGQHLYAYEDIVETVKSEQEGKTYDVKVRKDLTEKRDKRRALIEKAQLQELLDKYEDEVVRDLIKGGYITHETINSLLDAPKQASQDEKRKGETECQVHKDIQKELPT